MSTREEQSTLTAPIRLTWSMLCSPDGVTLFPDWGCRNWDDECLSTAYFVVHVFKHYLSLTAQYCALQKAVPMSHSVHIWNQLGCHTSTKSMGSTRSVADAVMIVPAVHHHFECKPNKAVLAKPT